VAGVRAVAAGFRAALVEGDSATALGYLHPELVVYEGGRRESLGEYRSGHLAGDMAYLAAVPPVLQDDTVVVAGDMALYLGESTSRGTFRGREIDRGTAETLVMVRTPAGWRIRHVHWSSGG
jgi:ketosteroid isomerase-like protein